MIFQFFNENYEFTENEKDIIPFKKIYDFFKDCDMTKQLTKEERRAMWNRAYVGTMQYLLEHNMIGIL